MLFSSEWITTPRFIDLKALSYAHKELDSFLTEEAPPETLDNHVFFAGAFVASGSGIYEVAISADDFYRLYVNGDFVCEGPEPSYHNNYSYNRVDISDKVHAGVNMVSVHVYYQGLVNRVTVSGDNRQGMIADFFGNGVYISGTDSTWRFRTADEYVNGGINGYRTAFLENLDFTKKLPGSLVGNGSGWAPVCVKHNDDHVFRDAPSDTVTVEYIKPLSVVKRRDGLFIDFGQELVGTVRLIAKGRKGDRLIIMCGEETDPADNLSVPEKARNGCCCRELCTLSGEWDDFDFFEYNAFRYVQITGDAEFEAESIRARARHRAFGEAVLIRSGIPALDSVWMLCRNTLKYAVQEIFPDCPSREKGQYLGDFTVSGLAYLHLTGDREAYRKTLFTFAETAAICPGLMSVAPCSFMQEIADYSLQYPLQVWNYYRLTGDTATLEKLYPVLTGLLAHFSAFENEDGLLVGVTDKWNLVDWPQNLRDNYTAPLDKPIAPGTLHNVINAYWTGANLLTERIAEVMGKKAVCRSAELAEAFNRTFFDSEAGLYADLPVKDSARAPHHSLHSNVLPVFFGFCRDAARPFIRNLIAERRLSCGVQFSYFVLKAAAALKDPELEMSILTGTSRHSWLNMINEGATTLFEAWSKDEKWNCSLCHPWASAPIIAVCEDFPELTVKNDRQAAV